MNYSIRKAVPGDVKFLPQIEKEASSLFIDYGLEAGVFADVTGLDELFRAQKEGLLWIAETNNKIIGFAFVEALNSGFVLSEIDVLPLFGKKGVGSQLLKEVLKHVKRSGHKKLFLTTFKEIPWNYPFYQKWGFNLLNPGEYPADITDIVEREHLMGLDRNRRVVMTISF